MNRLVNVVHTAPTDQEIAELEKKLAEMKAAKEEYRKKAIVDVRQVLEVIPEALEVDEIIKLMALLNKRLKSDHKKVRGSPVSIELQANLDSALKLNQHTLSQLERLFGLSISYISRRKKELGLTKPIRRQEEIVDPIAHNRAIQQLAS